MNTLSFSQLQQEFPFLKNGWTYLDNAATTQKPLCVLDAEREYYTTYCANVHRGIYTLSEQATEHFEQVREQVRKFIGARSSSEIIFTSGTTQSLNLAARLIAQRLNVGDKIILTEAEHHANLIPWQLIAKERGVQLQFLQFHEDGQIHPEDLSTLMTKKTKVLACTHISNASGYMLPIQKLIDSARECGLFTIIDAAQSVPHIPIDVTKLGADMIAFSAHKLCGPTGVGVLYGRKELLEQVEPVCGGGGMISEVQLTSSTWTDLPHRLEPGTPNIAGVIGFGMALQYVQTIGMNTIQHTIEKLTQYALKQLSSHPTIKLLGPKNHSLQHGIISFTVNGAHPHDIASLLSEDHIAVRAGHHCAQPTMKYWGVPATVRASFSFYNTTKDIDRMIESIQKAQNILV